MSESRPAFRPSRADEGEVVTDHESPRAYRAVMERKPTTSDLLRLMPLLSEIDTDKGIDAVLNTLRDIGVMRFDPERGRLIFVAMEVSADLLDREITRRLDG